MHKYLVVFLDGKRIKENIKKHKRNDISNHNRRPYKRRKLNDNDNKNKTKIKCKTKCKPKSKPKQKPSVEDYEIEEEGEEDPYGGLPYHFHLATHCEPKFISKHSNINMYTNIKTLLQPSIEHNNNNIEMDINRSNTPCKLYDIEYNNNNNHLILELSDNELELTDKLINNYDNILNKSNNKLIESDDIMFDNICVNNNNMNDKQMNDIIIADLKQYHFITNALNPTPTPPPIDYININKKINKDIILMSEIISKMMEK